MKSNFSPTANILIRKCFYARWINIKFTLWTNFIGIIWLHKLLMLFTATCVYNFSVFALWTPSSKHSPPRIPSISGHVGLRIRHKNSNRHKRGEETFLSFGHFFLRPFFRGHFFLVPRILYTYRILRTIIFFSSQKKFKFQLERDFVFSLWYH